MALPLVAALLVRTSIDALLTLVLISMPFPLSTQKCQQIHLHIRLSPFVLQLSTYSFLPTSVLYAIPSTPLLSEIVLPLAVLHSIPQSVSMLGILATRRRYGIVL